ncbi:OLC1v1015134C1 [Oldenlandia corymbosa var. corymbosa]|uniref:OLC1v1015134C1 n=1 Tax=Oldenlandia corymbosa var. corymbosa TaxID=529605 RepID=A0AAV1E2T1_OLDCO|nr:OLC1v1015134C1 [Oldenlandia corymbosa var. corymbosa]
MATSYAQGMANTSSSSQRGVAMVLALVSAVVLSPLYVDRRNDHKNFMRSYETKWSSGFVLPVVLAGLIVAIKTTSTASSYSNRGARTSVLNVASSEPSSVLQVGSSSWGLAGILVMLMFIMSWQSSLQHFLWR